MLAEINESWFNPEGRGTQSQDTNWFPDHSDRAEGNAQYDETHPGWSGRSKPKSKDEATEGSHVRHFEWQYRNYTANWELEVPKRLYRYYARRYRTRSFATYVADPFDRRYIQNLIERLEEFCVDNEFSADQLHEIALRFVQHFEYASDSVTQGELEYPKFPLETLLHEGGDCEDSSIILGAILRELGYDVAILVLPRKHHMMLGVSFDNNTGGATVDHESTEYTLVETTYPGWDYGEVPRKYTNANVRAYPVREQPVLVHEWSAQPQGDGTIKVDGIIGNFGNMPAEQVKGILSIESEDETLISQKAIITGETIYESNTLNFSKTVAEPRTDGKVRGKFMLMIGSSIHDLSTSFYR